MSLRRPPLDAIHSRRNSLEESAIGLLEETHPRMVRQLGLDRANAIIKFSPLVQLKRVWICIIP